MCRAKVMKPKRCHFFLFQMIFMYLCVCCEQYWTSPGGNTPQSTNYTATCLPSRKLAKSDEPDMQDTAGEAEAMYSYRPPHMAGQKQDGQHEHTFSSYVRIWDVALKTCQRRRTIGRSGERGSGISVLVPRHDDDDDDDDDMRLSLSWPHKAPTIRPPASHHENYPS